MGGHLVRIAKPLRCHIKWFHILPRQRNGCAKPLSRAEPKHRSNLEHYTLGQGAPKDLVLAYMWANLAAAHGVEIAQEVQDIVACEITRDQLAEAERMASEWTAERRQ